MKRDVPIVDGGGRAPSAQVNAAAADDLESYLRQYGLGQRVRRAVVLSHEKSELISNRNHTADIITDLKSFAIFDLLEKMSRISLNIMLGLGIVRNTRVVAGRRITSSQTASAKPTHCSAPSPKSAKSAKSANLIKFHPANGHSLQALAASKSCTNLFS